MSLVDVDGDGDRDLVLATFVPARNRLYLNDGKGAFADRTKSRMPKVTARSLSIAVGDLDRDGDPDLVIGNKGPTHLYLNDGKGRYSDASWKLPLHAVDYTLSIALGDVDGDGDLDAVTANASLGRAGQNRLLLNDGRAKFRDATTSQFVPDADPTSDVLLEDLDEDGDLDVLVGNYTRTGEGFGNRLYVNDGRGRFAGRSARIPGHRDLTRTLDAGDLDADGDVDVVVGNVVGVGSRMRVYHNLERHLHAPRPPRRGSGYVLVFHARPGVPPVPRVVLPGISLGAKRTRLPPLGVLWLDPATAVMLPPVAIGTTSGTGRRVVPVPADPTLRGHTAAAQGLVVSSVLPWRLTNGLSDGIR